MNYCSKCGAPLSLLSGMLRIFHCPRGHHWTEGGMETGNIVGVTVNKNGV